MKGIKLFIILIFLSSHSFASSSVPWLTGPILAPAGRTVPAGHFNLEPYAFYTTYPHNFQNFETDPVLTVGLLDFLDLQTTLPYDYNWFRNQHTSNIGDYALALGIQALRQRTSLIIPDLRITIQEIFPIGKFDNLNPTKLGTDQMGLGAYQTILGFQFQRLDKFYRRFLRTRLSINIDWLSSVKVEGFSVYGGTANTNATIKPTKAYSYDLAFEYALTQNWVPVFEMLVANSHETTFTGSPGFTPAGTIPALGGGGGTQVSLAPALEYNFNADLGLIGGVWFTVGHPPSKFVSYVIALNWYH